MRIGIGRDETQDMEDDDFRGDASPPQNRSCFMDRASRWRELAAIETDSDGGCHGAASPDT